MDADGDENEGGKGGGHGNTRLPYGIAKNEGINTEGMTPSEVWAALEGKGYSASDVYAEVKKTGHIPKKGTSISKSSDPDEEYFTAAKDIYNHYMLWDNMTDEQKARFPERDSKEVKDLYLRVIQKMEAAGIPNKPLAKANFIDAKRHLYQAKNSTAELQRKINSYDNLESFYNEHLKRATKISKKFAGVSMEDIKKESLEIDQEIRRLNLKKKAGTMTEEEKKRLSAAKRRQTDLERAKEYGQNESDFSVQKYKSEIARVQGQKKEAQDQADRVISNAENKYNKAKEKMLSTIKGWDDIDDTQVMQEWINSKHYFAEDCDFSKLGGTYQAVKDGLSKVTEMIDKYPVIKGKLGKMSVAELGEHTYADSYRYSEVRASATWFGNPKKCKAKYEQDVQVGFHPEGTTYEAILIHEYGHQIDEYLGKIFHSGDPFSNVVMNELKAKTGKNEVQLRSMVSKYAVEGATKYAFWKSNMEFFAEAWAEYNNSENPREIAKMVGGIVEDAFKKLEKEHHDSADNAIDDYRIRKLKRLKERYAAVRKDDDEENSSHGKSSNTRLPYGIAKSEGIDTTGMSPAEVWEALAGKGISTSAAYGSLKTGKKVTSETSIKSEAVTAQQEENAAGISKAMQPADDYSYSADMDYDSFVNQNIDELTPIFEEAEENGKDSELAIQGEYYKTRMANSTKGLHEIDKHEAEDIIGENVKQSWADGWLREADSGFKPKLVYQVTANPEIRNACLNTMFEHYKYATGSKMSFEEFLTTPVEMYRGGYGQKHTKDDVFSAYTFDKSVAEKFTKKSADTGGHGTGTAKLTVAKIRPIDTYGSITRNGEMEIWVPREIAPNGEFDSADGVCIETNPRHSSQYGERSHIIEAYRKRRKSRIDARHVAAYRARKALRKAQRMDDDDESGNCLVVR